MLPAAVGGLTLTNDGTFIKQSPEYMATLPVIAAVLAPFASMRLIGIVMLSSDAKARRVRHRNRGRGCDDDGERPLETLEHSVPLRPEHSPRASSGKAFHGVPLAGRGTRR